MAGKLGIKNFSGELLPEDKLRRVKELGARGKTMFIGDGINDAPVLQGSDVGVAIGAKEGIASVPPALRAEKNLTKWRFFCIIARFS